MENEIIQADKIPVCLKAFLVALATQLQGGCGGA
jgi:hypothetical protein